ncbi:MAG TPA: hypothetical protein VEH57_04135 [Thermoplasmata archaeon]|nr:hypothetical protein [Thermoplasmata archaeon]
MAAPTVDDWTRSIIGIGIAFASLATIILAWTYRSTADAQAISAGMTALVGSILGYYFGAKGVDAAQSNATDQTTRRVKTREAANQYQAKVQDLIAKHRTQKAISADDMVNELSKLDWTSFYTKD